MYGPHVAILLMCVSRNTRRVDFRGLTGSQRTPRVWGVTRIGRPSKPTGGWSMGKSTGPMAVTITAVVKTAPTTVTGVTERDMI